MVVVVFELRLYFLGLLVAVDRVLLPIRFCLELKTRVSDNLSEDCCGNGVSLSSTFDVGGGVNVSGRGMTVFCLTL